MLKTYNLNFLNKQLSMVCYLSFGERLTIFLRVFLKD